MSKLIQGATFDRMSEMDEAARNTAIEVVSKLAAAYYAGRDSAKYATNVREEARDQLLAAMAAMRVRRFEAGPYRVIRTLDRSRTLNLAKLAKLLGDKADKLQSCYDESPRQSIQVYHHRADELEHAARAVGRKQVTAATKAAA
jgi:hypothetical protein